MSAVEAFKVAAAHIRQGVQAQRHDIDALRVELEHRKREIDAHTNRLRDAIRSKEADIARSQAQQLEPDKDRAQKLREVSEMHDAIVRADHDFTREREQVLGQISQLERDLVNLEQQANSLASRG